jgi:hypothetical protein
MTIHRLVLASAALLLGATPMAEAGGRHVDISVNLGYYLPVHMGYVERVAPVVVYPPTPAIYYRPVYGQPDRHYYRDYGRYDRHERWHHREEHRRHHDRDRDED